MIRGRGESEDGKPIMILGISRRNIERLMAGEPIRATGESVGIPSLHSVLIFFGETEAVMAEDLREAGLIKSDVVVHRETTAPDGVTP